MGNFVYNVSLGTIVEKVRNSETLELLMLKAADADSVLKDLDDIAAVLANGSTTQADFTNYARKTLASVTATVDDTADDIEVDAADVVFTSAGGAANNTLTDAVIYDDVDGSDANAEPLVQLDAAATTDGNDLTLQFDADGWFRAS